MPAYRPGLKRSGTVTARLGCVTPAGAGGRPPRTAASAALSMAPTPLLPVTAAPLTAPERLTVKRTVATPPLVPAAA